jgi:hypothetical protein
MARIEVTGRKANQAPKSAAGARPPVRAPPSHKRGPYGLTVPEAGAMIGLGKNASYQAARNGQIPVMKFNGTYIVPKLQWLRMIGAEEVA